MPHRLIVALFALGIAGALGVSGSDGLEPAAALAPGPVAQPPARLAVSSLTNRELAGQRIVTGFGGSSPPPALRAAIRRGRVAGVVLFTSNASTAAAARTLTERLQAIPQPRGLRRPLLVMTDQEGGLVKRLAGPPHASAQEMGRRGNDYTHRQGRATGKLLRAGGINIDLAPVLDVARRGGAIDSEHRAFGRGARRVSQRASAFARGLRGHGVVPTAKHFPGLGAAAVNTDAAAQTIGLSRSKLRRVDERPYERFRKGGRGLVMLSLASYPAFGGGPAALSRRIAGGELRRRLHFRGVSISDSLGAAAAQAAGGTRKVARKAAGAGTDLLLYPSLGQALSAGDVLARAVHRGKLSRKRFRHSVARVLKLRRSFAR